MSEQTTMTRIDHTALSAQNTDDQCGHLALDALAGVRAQIEMLEQRLPDRIAWLDDEPGQWEQEARRLLNALRAVVQEHEAARAARWMDGAELS